ncbi:MAG: PAS domain-containing sensor histidine kinase [Granulosicoccus sp.]|nr:PAS domain-containing sensor histidine kinase [Granulosicoccus sp.]
MTAREEMLQLDQYQLALAISPVPMLLVSKTGEIMLTNQLLDGLFGYEPSELSGERVEILIPESFHKHHPDLREAYFRLPSKRNMGHGRDLNGITKTGEIIPLELGLDSVTVDGEICALVVALDIRYRKLHENRMNLAMDAAASAMIMVDEQGLIVFVNKAALLLFGYEETELLNSPVERLVPREIRHVHPTYRNSFMSASNARPMAKELDLHALHRDGHRIPVEIALTPVETPTQTMVVSTIIDLSERLEAERMVAAKSRELAQVNNELTQFAYSASHDLKAPLSSIVGLLAVCHEDLDDGNLEEVRENLQKCLQISRRSADKVEGVLAIARVDRDAFTYETVMLEPIIREMWLDLTGPNEFNVRLLLELDHADPVSVELNTFKVILENLLSNAIRYRDYDKENNDIIIRTSSRDENLTVAVTDNGIGIPEGSQHAVFEMFKRIDERSDDGLGLALVKKQIERLNGTIALESIEGTGTTFTITLPLHEGNGQ